MEASVPPRSLTPPEAWAAPVHLGPAIAAAGTVRTVAAARRAGQPVARLRLLRGFTVPTRGTRVLLPGLNIEALSAVVRGVYVVVHAAVVDHTHRAEAAHATRPDPATEQRIRPLLTAVAPQSPVK